MALPEYLDDPFVYELLNSVTDVQTIIDAFQTLAVTDSDPAWSEPSANLFRSPTDAAGRWFDVLLTATTATSLTIRMRDSSSNTVIERRIYIDAGGCDVHVIVGSHFFDILSQATAGQEYAMGGIFDMYPEAQNVVAVPRQHWGKAYRSTAGTAESTYPHWAWTWGTTAYVNAEAFWTTHMNRNLGLSFVCASIYTGAYYYLPMYGTINSAKLGCVYNHVFGPVDILSGAIETVTIGGVAIQLLALRIGYYGYRLFVRVG